MYVLRKQERQKTWIPEITMNAPSDFQNTLDV